MLLFFRQCWYPPKIKQLPIESQFVDKLRHSQIQLSDDSIKSCFNQEVKRNIEKQIGIMIHEYDPDYWMKNGLYTI